MTVKQKVYCLTKGYHTLDTFIKNISNSKIYKAELTEKGQQISHKFPQQFTTIKTPLIEEYT